RHEILVRDAAAELPAVRQRGAGLEAREPRPAALLDAAQRADDLGATREVERAELTALERRSHGVVAADVIRERLAHLGEHGVQVLEVARDEQLRLRPRDVVADARAVGRERQLAHGGALTKMALAERRQQAGAVEAIVFR